MLVHENTAVHCLFTVH